MRTRMRMRIRTRRGPVPAQCVFPRPGLRQSDQDIQNNEFGRNADNWHRRQHHSTRRGQLVSKRQRTGAPPGRGPLDRNQVGLVSIQRQRQARGVVARSPSLMAMRSASSPTWPASVVLGEFQASFPPAMASRLRLNRSYGSDRVTRGLTCGIESGRRTDRGAKEARGLVPAGRAALARRGHVRHLLAGRRQGGIDEQRARVRAEADGEACVIPAARQGQGSAWPEW